MPLTSYTRRPSRCTPRPNRFGFGVLRGRSGGRAVIWIRRRSVTPYNGQAEWDETGRNACHRYRLVARSRVLVAGRARKGSSWITPLYLRILRKHRSEPHLMLWTDRRATQASQTSLKAFVEAKGLEQREKRVENLLQHANRGGIVGKIPEQAAYISPEKPTSSHV